MRKIYVRKICEKKIYSTVLLFSLVFSGFAQRAYFSTEPFEFGVEPSSSETKLSTDKSIYGVIVFDGKIEDYGLEVFREYIGFREASGESIDMKIAASTMKRLTVSKDGGAANVIEKNGKVFMYIDILPDPSKSIYGTSYENFKKFWQDYPFKEGKSYILTFSGAENLKFKATLEIAYAKVMSKSDVSTRFEKAYEKSGDFYYNEKNKKKGEADLSVAPHEDFAKFNKPNTSEPAFTQDKIKAHIEKFYGRKIKILSYGEGYTSGGNAWSPVYDDYKKEIAVQTTKLYVVWKFEDESGEPWCWNHKFRLKKDKTSTGYGELYLISFHPNAGKKRCACSLVKN